MLYASGLIQQGTMMITDLLNADLKIPTFTQFNAKLNLGWQENRHDKLISAIPIEWRMNKEKPQKLFYIALMK